MRKRKIEWLGRSRVSEGAATPQPAGERALRGNGAGGSGGGGKQISRAPSHSTFRNPGLCRPRNNKKALEKQFIVIYSYCLTIFLAFTRSLIYEEGNCEGHLNAFSRSRNLLKKVVLRRTRR